MKHKAAKLTADLHPNLTPFERHKMFLESRQGPISQIRYGELLKAHFPKK